ncbi:putative DNA repair and transcription factor Ada, partial [Aspergillus niger CBS 101883]|uniref:putative DNA repair and transcription factor Ada n=1 Tax=Aspergillus lacticoffeatus (strain CBS 101883) TaxID=1450533 RepID=UPI000D7FF70B
MVPPPKLPLPKPSLSPSSTSPSTRWLAIQTRDPKFTNAFVYAVLTTKIYCRPTCPARLARRANVRFYDTASQAELAGFRPCKRCKPEIVINNSNNFTTFHPQIPSVQRACQTIRASVQAGSKPTLRMLAAEAGLTPSHFHRVFKRVMGVTVGRYVVDVMRKSGDGEVLEGSCRDWVGGEGEGAGNWPVLWNDFDVLLAAEEE